MGDTDLFVLALSPIGQVMRVPIHRFEYVRGGCWNKSSVSIIASLRLKNGLLAVLNDSVDSRSM